MRNVERVRVREREPGPQNTYEAVYQYLVDLRERSFKGAIVIDGESRPWEPSRQGVYRFFQMRETDNGTTALRNWDIFISNVRKHSGRHVHQGGLVIFVLEGEGYSIVDGERVDWEAGDLILLPTKPDGVEHQHFN